MNKAEKYLKKIVNGHFIRKAKHKQQFEEKEKLEKLIFKMVDENTKGYYGDCILIKDMDVFAKMVTAKILTEFIIIIEKGVIE